LNSALTSESGLVWRGRRSPRAEGPEKFFWGARELIVLLLSRGGGPLNLQQPRVYECARPTLLWISDKMPGLLEVIRISFQSSSMTECADIKSFSQYLTELFLSPYPGNRFFSPSWETFQVRLARIKKKQKREWTPEHWEIAFIEVPGSILTFAVASLGTFGLAFLFIFIIFSVYNFSRFQYTTEICI